MIFWITYYIVLYLIEAFLTKLLLDLTKGSSAQRNFDFSLAMAWPLVWGYVIGDKSYDTYQSLIRFNIKLRNLEEQTND